MPIQIKAFKSERDTNNFLKTLEPAAVQSVQMMDQHFIVTYDSNFAKNIKQVNPEESSRVIDLLANQADQAWADVDSEIGNAKLPMVASILINQVLSYYFPDTHPLSKARSTINSVDLDTVINQTILKLADDADAFQLFQIQLNSRSTDQGNYGYLLASFYRQDPNNDDQPVTYLSFLDNRYQIHGNDFILDATAAPQWRLFGPDEQAPHQPNQF